MASILDQLDRLGDEQPHKLLYSYIDLNGNRSSATPTRRLSTVRRRSRTFAEGWSFRGGGSAFARVPAWLEMICAFFGCVRAGLIPVPSIPESRGFQSALYKMVYIASICQASGILTSKDTRILKTNLTRSGSLRPALTLTTSPVFRGSSLKSSWIRFGRTPCRYFEDSVSPVHLGSTMEPRA